MQQSSIYWFLCGEWGEVYEKKDPIRSINCFLRRLSDRLDYAKKRIMMIREQETEINSTLRDVTYTTSSPRRPLKVLKNRLRIQQKNRAAVFQINTYPFRQDFNPRDTGRYSTVENSEMKMIHHHN